MTARRVVVTGLGVICALGHNLAEVWCALRAGRSGIGPIRSLDVSNLRFQNGAEVREYDRSEEHTSELQSRPHLVCRLLLEKKKHLSKIPISQPTLELLILATRNAIYVVSAKAEGLKYCHSTTDAVATSITAVPCRPPTAV